MLSMQACVSPDGSTISYYDGKIDCASMGLNEYHWRPEPLPHIWAWLQTPAGQIIAMMTICTLLVLVLGAKDRFKRVEHGADQTT